MDIKWGTALGSNTIMTGVATVNDRDFAFFIDRKPEWSGWRLRCARGGDIVFVTESDTAVGAKALAAAFLVGASL